MTALQAHRLADAAAQGFSESALRSRSADMAPGALAIAQRHDPYALADPRDHQADMFAARLQQTGPSSGPVSGFAPPAGRFSPPAQPFRTVSALSGAREMECLTQAVYYEARGETAAGQAAVAQVVLNRVRHPGFPKSVCGVVFQGAQVGHACQFSFACDGSLYRTRETTAWRRAQSVAARALAGFVMAEVGNATHFHAARIGPQWDSMVRVAQVGLHVFYRFGGRGGAPGSFRQIYRPDAQPQAIYASLIPVVETPRFLAADAGAAKDSPRSADAPADGAKGSDAKPAPAKAPETGAEPVSGPAPAKAAQAAVSAS